MKLTLQLVVVVLNTQTSFRDNLLKFTVQYNITHKVGGRRWHLGHHVPSLTQLFKEIRTTTVNGHARIVKIG